LLGLLLVLMLSDAPEYHIKDTEIFQVMLKDEVHVTSEGEVYLLNFESRQVQHYAADGKLKNTIGRKGKGPGEFTFPILFRVIDKHIYVQDELNQMVAQFTMDGTYVRQMQLPGRNIKLDRANKGWMFWDMGDTMNPSSSELKWADADFKESRTIAPIVSTGWGRGVNARTRGGVRKITYSPLSVSPRMAMSPNGERCYLADAELYRIEVYDGHSAKHLYSISSSDKPLPFDTEWADERFLVATEVDRQRNPGVTIQKLYPKVFPAIRSMSFNSEGQLVVDRWRGRPDKNHYLKTYNNQGVEVPTVESFNTLRRTMGVAKGMAYVMVLEEGEDSGLVKVPVDQVNDFVKANPITDWAFSRNIEFN